MVFGENMLDAALGNDGCSLNILNGYLKKHGAEKALHGFSTKHFNHIQIAGVIIQKTEFMTYDPLNLTLGVYIRLFVQITKMLS